ncbi:MAG TPA: hypothetical protein VHB72_02895 [Candidatus Saccharimonadales bacterium]|nr:hypothetical protein [Candidatus Saccharimonadales bacterium]
MNKEINEQFQPAPEDPGLSNIEASLFIAAAGNIIGSLFLPERASKKAFWIGVGALVPLAYQMKKQEEEWHRQNPWLRSSAPIH